MKILCFEVLYVHGFKCIVFLLFSDMQRLNTVDAEVHDTFYHSELPRRASFPTVSPFAFPSDKLDRSKEMLDLTDDVSSIHYCNTV